jgi:hypothetical protein
MCAAIGDTRMFPLPFAVYYIVDRPSGRSTVHVRDQLTPGINPVASNPPSRPESVVDLPGMSR